MPSSSKKTMPAAAAAARQVGKQANSKTFTFKPKHSPTRGGAKFSAYNTQAFFETFKATFQKGDKMGQLSGNIYVRLCPGFGKNAAYKALVETFLLGEYLKWNDEIKRYIVKVLSREHAQLYLNALKELDANDAKALPDEVDAADFEDAKVYTINIINTTLGGDGVTTKADEVIVLEGDTFPFKEKLKELGFSFTLNFNDTMGCNVWLGPKATADVDGVEALCAKFGVIVEKFDNASFTDMFAE